MNESALRTVLDNLDASRLSLHGLLHVFTFLVVLGLGFDLFVIIKEFRDDLKKFRQGVIQPPERPSALLLVLALFGTALIVLGVAGELYVDVKAGKVETDIRAANDELLGLISQEAGTAKTSAEGAADAASRANNAAGEAERKVSAVAKRAERIGAELGELEFLGSPRRIFQPDELSGELKKHFKGRRIIVTSYIGDQEGGELCRQLAYIAQKGEMDAIDTCSKSGLTSPLATSVVVSGPDRDETEEIGKILVTVGRLSFGGSISGFKRP